MCGVSWWNHGGSHWMGNLRHEEYVRQDSVQAIHAAHVMVGMCDGLYQIGIWV